MNEQTIWSNGLAALPGIEYQKPPNIRAPYLPKAQATPQVLTPSFGDGSRASLIWELPDGSTSASPAQRWECDSSDAELTTSEHVALLHTRLALPGTPSDYHFAIQSTSETIWGRRKIDTNAVAVVEKLCLLSLELVEAYPKFLRHDGHVARVVAFQRLVDMYEKSGDIEAALAIAQRAESFGNDTRSIGRLQEKRNILAQELVP